LWLAAGFPQVNVKKNPDGNRRDTL